ncbi:MAG: tetratricopeptide repeat protein, partial [Stigonema ocellatum SAG 48.90 = DSM 106950]|nr:tetratricopeptide repeat protein [Stigonema ocellatum SAG 48.90 = DSM 106950]
MNPTESTTYSLSATDQAELNKLVSYLELSSTTTVFAIAPESGPQHPVVDKLKFLLNTSDEDFEVQPFFYSDNSLHNFLYSLGETDQGTSQTGHKLVMAFGIDQLPIPRLVREMKQLNLGRESLFERGLALIFWLNKAEFLDEFRNRAPDFWDWRGKVVKFEARPTLNRLFYPYIEWLIAENSYLKISGVMQVQRQVDIFLDQIYISLQAERRKQVTEIWDRGDRNIHAATSPEAEYRQNLSKISSSSYDLDEPYYYERATADFIPISTTTKTVTQKVDLSQAVRETQYSVILGAPGAGKTTLLRYLALHFATAKRDGHQTVVGGEAQEALGKSLLPIFFRIADYAERLDKSPELSLLDYLRQFHRQWEEAYFQTEAGTEVAALLLDAMQQGQCLMLLDGLDEVFDQQSRKLIVNHINQFVDAYSANKFVITSRIAGYGDVKLGDRFTEFTIEDMGSEQAEKFLHRWCRAIEKAQQPDASEEQWQRLGDAEAQEILEAIKDNEGVKRLTANPLLLTILALIHRNGSRLPNRRVELYALAVKTLTEDWQLGKKLPDAPKVILKENEVVELLAPLAYWMHEEKPSGLVTQAEVKEKLAEKLAELNDAEPESDLVQQAVEQFLRKVRETTGLFVERAPGLYGFMHLTFEEYFAARYIAENDQSDILHLIRKHLHEPRWNEPLLLALGYYSSYSSKQVNKLVEKLFSNLDAYAPTLEDGEFKIKNASSPDATLVWSPLESESATTCHQSEFPLQDLLFASQVLAQVEVTSPIRLKLIQKLIVTYIGLDTDLEDNTTKQLLRQLRQIEVFNYKNEVITQLKQAAHNSKLSQDMRIKAQSAILYVACGEPGAGLVSCATNIVSHLEPLLFSSIRGLVAELGEEMTPALETSQKNYSHNQDSQRALNFLTAISYIRTDKYKKAIALLEEITAQQDSILSPYIAWALATCHEEESEYNKAIDYYEQSSEQLASYPEQTALLILWRERGCCYRLHTQYEKALECFQHILSLAQESKSLDKAANALYNIARTYQAWGKYEQAIANYQQSRDLYEQLGKQQNVANQWYWLADCYREWSKYEQALECQHKVLAIRQQLDDQPRIALAYRQLGRIYQAWGKYEQAIAHFQQSLDLYEQLGKQKDVADLWYNLAGCYREWSKYQQALECELKDLAIRQQLDDQPRIALAYYQLGRIYQAWGKYEQARANYQQRRDLYEQLRQQHNVATLWYWLADCYGEWGKYQQALDCQHKNLAICQQLDDQPKIADAYYQLGRIYQAWGKYEQARANYQQSRDLYEQLGKQEDVALEWTWLALCYREWGKYEQALECELKDLAIRQQLDDQPRIALAYLGLGRIYQAWGKYEQARDYYQQSRDLYEQLGKQQDVANQWYRLADCYREWSKYQQALECEHKDLAIRQQLDDQPNIADAYYQLGRIYQAWGKYEQARDYYQQSRNLYEQLGKQQNVADLWYNLADCYREWS